MREAEITQMWSLYEPSWRVQLEMAAARIASARSTRPDLFHPLARSVVESVHERIARGTTRRDGESGLRHLGLTVDQVLERAAATHTARRRGPINDFPAPTNAPVLAPPPATALLVTPVVPPPPAESRNGHGRPATAAESAVQR